MQRNPYYRALDIISCVLLVTAILFVLFLPFFVLLMSGQWIPWLFFVPGLSLVIVVFGFLADRWDKNNR